MSTSQLADPLASEWSPVTTDVLQSTAAKIGVRVSSDREAEFTEMLASAREAMEQVSAMDGMPT